MPSVLITGATKGLGLAFVKYYLSQGWVVLALHHDIISGGLEDLEKKFSGTLYFIDLNLNNSEEYSLIHSKIPPQIDFIDLIINCTGVNSYSLGENKEEGKELESLEYETLLQMFSLNTVAPIMVVKSLLDKVSLGTKIINISSIYASISAKDDGGNYGYCGSKIALNMLTKILAHDLGKFGVIVVSMHPGFISKDNNLKGKMTPDQAVEILSNTISSLTLHKNGHFINYDGEDLPI